MIIVFDAQCLLCNRWVQFLLRRPGGRAIRFASMQGATGMRLLAEAGLPTEGLETLLVIEQGRALQHTAAILRVLQVLGWPWRLAGLLRLVPAPLRDRAYRWLARNRYRLFGRSQACMLPATQDAARFLD